MQSDYISLYGSSINPHKTNLKDTLKKTSTLQQIFYGAPGTGKSNTIKREVDDKGLPNVRTTFHPDSDYSTFVGAYKPTSTEVPMMTMIGTKAVPVENPDGTPRKEKKIVYEFVPQAFLKAYTGAWKNQDEPFFLIIEEINRGNCAQIFGDLFQLLDRNDETGLSDYPISPDEDIRKFLQTDKKYGFAALTEEQKAAIPEKVLSGEWMILPGNLHIWATMNTSDQSLFPIDSAFKRRWDWLYMPISDGGKGWQIKVNGKRYDWWEFVQKINNKIGFTTNSEDKKLGYYFCKAKNGVIDAETFVGKVFFYIWNDVFKDFAEEAGDLFKDTSDTENPLLSFNKFYTVGMDGKTKVVEDKVELFLQNLGVNEVEDSVHDGDEVIDDTESGSRRILHVEFEDETIAIKRFPQYLQVLKKIGLDKAETVASEKEVDVLGCALVTKEREEAIEQSQYSYVESDGYYVIKGIKGKVMLNFLPLISNKYNLNLKIGYK
ncbi:MAG: AAA family ATPase [Bacteroidaceae bacterium]|nr:AAA family ATPase [Bacteroidaceae bacterium]